MEITAGQISQPLSPRRALHQGVQPGALTETTVDSMVWSWAEQKLSGQGADAVMTENARSAAEQLSPGMLALLFEEAGRLSYSPKRAKADDEVLSRYGQEPADPAQQERVTKAWQQLAPHCDRDLSVLTTTSELYSYAGAANSTMVVKPTDFSDDNTLLFVMAHEAGHLLNSDMGRSLGLDLIPDLDRVGGTAFAAISKSTHHAIEEAADRFAVGVASSQGCDPKPILAALLETEEGDDHPDGIKRASLVREEFATRGVLISDLEWTGLLNDVEPIREARRLRQERLANERAAIPWDKFQ